jgi:hypothetical protein
MVCVAIQQGVCDCAMLFMAIQNGVYGYAACRERLEYCVHDCTVCVSTVAWCA